jgi:hypothetical protein
MTFTEAIDWVSKKDNCSRSEATRQIRAAVPDKAISGLRWEDERPGMTAVLDYYPDYPPTDRQFWTSEDSIPDEKGRIFDPRTKQRRTLLILKDNIFHLWPGPSVATAVSENGQATEYGSNVEPSTKAKRGGRPSDMEKFYQALDRLSQQGRRVKDMDPMKAVTLAADACGKKVGEPRWRQRTLLDHLRKWRWRSEYTD